MTLRGPQAMVFEGLNHQNPRENTCEMTLRGPQTMVFEGLNRQNPCENTCEMTAWGPKAMVFESLIFHIFPMLEKSSLQDLKMKQPLAFFSTCAGGQPGVPKP